MNIKTLKILIIPFLLAVMLGGTYLMPRRGEVQDSSISMDLPTGMNPSGWHGTRRQESEQERGILAPDTEFPKRITCRNSPSAWMRRKPYPFYAAFPSLNPVMI